MGKPRTPRLKVFQTRIGFYDTVVAAPSQAAALRAWGLHQNLFADGQAGPATDEQAIAAALAHPETPLKRPVGSADPFELEPANLPKVPDAPKRKAAPAAKRAPAAPPRPKPDRSALNAAEAALRQVDDDRKREEAEFRRRRDALAAEEAEAQTAYVEARKAASTALVATRDAYRKAGGTD